MQINDHAVIVTGGASGLGEATVRLLVSMGAKVSIFDLVKEKGEKVAAELGDSVVFCYTDITDETSVEAAITKTISTLGLFHVVVNCAGVGTPGKVLGKDGPMSIEQFRKVVEINLIGTMNVIRLTAEKMVQNKPNEESERAVIINTASGAAFEGQIGQSAYSASKAGIVGMTLPIAREFADYGIRIVTIAPGLFETPMLAGLPEKAKAALATMVPFPKRLGRPSEFALLVKQIIENPMLNGCTIRLDAALRLNTQ